MDMGLGDQGHKSAHCGVLPVVSCVHFSSRSLKTFSPTHESRGQCRVVPPTSDNTWLVPVFYQHTRAFPFSPKLSDYPKDFFFFSQLRPPLPSAHCVGKELPLACLLVLKSSRLPHMPFLVCSWLLAHGPPSCRVSHQL